MPASLKKNVLAALESFLKAATHTIQELKKPYGALREEEPDGSLGSPPAIAFYDEVTRLGFLAETVVRAGGEANALFDCERNERILDQIITDFRAGRYATNSAKNWFQTLDKVEQELKAAVALACQQALEYEQLAVGTQTVRGGKVGLAKDMLRPQDLVEDLGIGVAAVRKRIRSGHLGPWKSEGNRWMILRKDFEVWLASEVAEIKAGTSAGDATRRADVLRLMERGGRRRGRGGGKGTPS